MIGLVVDSNSQMPVDLAAALGAVVVPLTVTVDGVDHLEGVDLDADAFYAHWRNGHVPEISTSQPSPGAFVDAYASVVAGGATSILSVHVGASLSGTLNSARLAAEGIDAPIRLVDTGTASFGISCCAWAAADAIRSGADLETAAVAAEARARSLHTSFVVGVPSLVERSGRADGLEVAAAADEGIPVIAATGDDFSILATAHDVDGAVEAMVADALAWSPSSDRGLRIAVGTSDDSSRPVAERITERVSGDHRVAEVVQYRIGPSIGAFTGPGTAGLFVF